MSILLIYFIYLMTRLLLFTNFEYFLVIILKLIEIYSNTKILSSFDMRVLKLENIFKFVC